MAEEKSWWTCSECGYTLQAKAPPGICPGCRKKCLFVESTCYTPECGGPANPDPQIILRRGEPPS